MAIISNNSFQRSVNLALIARLIWERGQIARADIARELGLYRSTVTNITNYLLENGMIIECGAEEASSKGGRRPVGLEINASFGAVLGIDLKISHFSIVLIDLKGNEVWKHVGLTPQVGFEEIIISIMEFALKGVEKAGLPLLGVCFALPGIIDQESGVIVYSEPLHMTTPFPFYELFRSRYPGLHVIIENDANSSAWYEMNRDLSLTRTDFITLFSEYYIYDTMQGVKAGVGVGTALAMKGKVYRGAHFSAGEFCSSLWRGNDIGQTSIPDKLVYGIPEERDVYERWLSEVFTSFIPVISVFDPAFFIITGHPFEDWREELPSLISTLAPGFMTVLEKYGCTLVIEDGSDDMKVARGAALMYLNAFFSIPELSATGSVLYFELNKVIQQARA